MPKLILIAAVSENGVIGNKGQIPWKIPADMKRFKELTIGHPVLMGRKTWDSLPQWCRPLPDRMNIILTRRENPMWMTYGIKDKTGEHTSVFAIDNLDDLKEKISSRINREIFKNKDIYIIGGAEIYKQTIEIADRLEITKVHNSYEGDVSFPFIDPAKWEVKSWNRICHADFSKDYSFITYERIRKTTPEIT